MTYLQYFSDNSLYLTHQNNDKIEGKCFSMCPEEECQMRKKERLLHPLEVLEDSVRMVKSYSRSAADSNMAKPHLLRPYSVLSKTVQYLLIEVTKRHDVSEVSLYDFVNDRLRAVRQDMTIQRLGPDLCVKLLDPMVRFYVFYGYKLSDCPIKNFDPVLNKKHLLECLKWYLSCSDQNDKLSSMDQIIKNLTTVSLCKKTEGLVHDRIMMENLYILCNLNDLNPVYRYLKLRKEYQRNPKLRLAYRIAVANIRNNFVQVARLSRNLDPLSYCAFCTHLPQLQKTTLCILSHAFSSMHLTVPSTAIRKWLLLDSDRQAIKVCKHYGLKVDGDKVHFSKNDFQSDASPIIIKCLGDKRLQEKLEVYLSMA